MGEFTEIRLAFGVRLVLADNAVRSPSGHLSTSIKRHGESQKRPLPEGGMVVQHQSPARATAYARAP